jgi:hypothetical protein
VAAQILEKYLKACEGKGAPEQQLAKVKQMLVGCDGKQRQDSQPFTSDAFQKERADLVALNNEDLSNVKKALGI